MRDTSRLTNGSVASVEVLYLTAYDDTGSTTQVSLAAQMQHTHAAICPNSLSSLASQSRLPWVRRAYAGRH